MRARMATSHNNDTWISSYILNANRKSCFDSESATRVATRSKNSPFLAFPSRNFGEQVLFCKSNLIVAGQLSFSHVKGVCVLSADFFYLWIMLSGTNCLN